VRQVRFAQAVDGFISTMSTIICISVVYIDIPFVRRSHDLLNPSRRAPTPWIAKHVFDHLQKPNATLLAQSQCPPHHESAACHPRESPNTTNQFSSTTTLVPFPPRHPLCISQTFEAAALSQLAWWVGRSQGDGCRWAATGGAGLGPQH
jgi:hypothetical protein